MGLNVGFRRVDREILLGRCPEFLGPETVKSGWVIKLDTAQVHVPYEPHVLDAAPIAGWQAGRTVHRDMHVCHIHLTGLNACMLHASVLCV